ncbi:MAG: hypothetical protein J6Q53_01865 [Oscillospiraceae bacterium]|nr:hypothetical protein [Oscillospiraceae bacterium]
MDRKFAEDVYGTLCGLLEEPYQVSGVEDLFAEGCPCEKNYERMRQAYERLTDRLGVVDEDEDLEIMVDSLLQICHDVGIGMYHYGQVFAKEGKALPPGGSRPSPTGKNM